LNNWKCLKCLVTAKDLCAGTWLKPPIICRKKQSAF